MALRALRGMEELFTTIKRRARTLLLCGVLAVSSPVAAAEPESIGCGDRIVALSPSLAEVVDQLGLTEKLVAVSRYTKYPPAAARLANAGGLLDPNLEGILALKPSLVLGLNETGDLVTKLKAFGVTTAIYDHRRIKGILDSIRDLGSRCAVSERAEAVLKTLSLRTDRVSAKTFGKKKVTALVLIGTKEDAQKLNNLYVSGRDGFYTDLLTLAGAENVFVGLTGAFSSVSREALIKADPDYIVQVVSGEDASAFERRAIRAAWDDLPYLKAVKANQVLLLADYVDSIPGPRYPDVLDKVFTFIQEGRR